MPPAMPAPYYMCMCQKVYTRNKSLVNKYIERAGFLLITNGMNIGGYITIEHKDLYPSKNKVTSDIPTDHTYDLYDWMN